MAGFTLVKTEGYILSCLEDINEKRTFMDTSGHWAEEDIIGEI